MKFKAYKMAFAEIDQSSVITQSDGVRLVIKSPNGGGFRWEIRGIMQNKVLASWDSGYTLELSFEGA